MSRIEELLKKNRFVGTFGVSYLDHEVYGIMPNDLILIGARSGAGKSDLATQIAQHNARQGIPVSLISLENFPDDDFMVRVYYAYKRLADDYDLKPRQFLGGIGTFFHPDPAILSQAEKEAEAFFKNIALTVRTNDFGIEDLKKTMVKNVEVDKCRMIILDHIDYLDKIDPRENDITHVTEIMRTIRRLQNGWNVPVVAISHLRKLPNAKDAPKIPSMDEFIGSGNKVKEATMVIVVAPDDERNETALDKTLASTFFCIRKLRQGGYQNQCGRLQYDRRTGRYREEYEKCSVNYAGTEVTPYGKELQYA